ncbi:ABC-type nitrate/sulfonate/bicarbonate transport system, permease component [Thermanaerovibrio velox DSM 12556]|uniref:ABC-type nitrate/sulfonate/bicarbonate transport system, permease component n=1 Tax=Thermanaerovibrio velox DSM 12556 TaxID=926567 RepID=H0UQC3_9BACT|nr:ABC transporter permease [Thermanaerovibrio velox]EHM10761.1 ABC-type nitrate/sulfonate/bicarbonate transport system, permease component [Thermanaerovibrio velox DSM 12556]
MRKHRPWPPGPIGGLLVSAALPLVIWYAASSLGGIGSFLLPSPTEVFKTLLSLLGSGELPRHVFVSLYRVLQGFLVSSLAGVMLGTLLGLSRGLRACLGPLLEFMRHIPPLAVLPLFILWLGIGEASKVAVIVAASFFPVFLSTVHGVAGADKRLVEVGKAFGVSDFRIVTRIVLPCAMGPIMAGLRLGLGYGWRSLIGAELVAASSGLGYLINDAQAMLRTDVILAGVVVLGLIGGLTDRVFTALLGRLGYLEEADES